MLTAKESTLEDLKIKGLGYCTLILHEFEMKVECYCTLIPGDLQLLCLSFIRHAKGTHIQDADGHIQASDWKKVSPGELMAFKFHRKEKIRHQVRLNQIQSSDICFTNHIAILDIAAARVIIVLQTHLFSKMWMPNCWIKISMTKKGKIIFFFIIYWSG